MIPTFKSIMHIVAVSVAISCSAEDIKRPNSYNYLRGVEEMNAENYEEARDYFNKEMAENPENGYTHVWMSCIQSDYSEALSSVNKGIKLLPKADKEFLASAYTIKSQIYLYLNDTIKAMTDLRTAIETNPESTQPLELRGQLYYEMGDYEKSDADYRQLIELDEATQIGYMGLARNARNKKAYQSAIDQLDRAIKLYPDNGRAYSFRAESYLALKKYNEAVDDIMNIWQNG